MVRSMRWVRQQVARQLGVPRELVSMWETEARAPSEAHLAALAQVYRVEPGVLTREAGSPPEAERAAFERWLDFLDRWADFLEAIGEAPSGPGKPPRKLDHGPDVTDARRAPTLADEVRDYYGLGRNALPNLRAYLDERDVLVYRDALGAFDAADAVASAFFNHARLGFCILVNTDASPGRQAFSMAHGYAHALYHYAARGIVCHANADEPVERFANTFAPHFLVPRR